MPDEPVEPIPARLDPFANDQAPDVDAIEHDTPRPDLPEDQGDPSIVPEQYRK